ncbi:hypothetical protein AAEU29_11230 [Pseudoalteromonas sp. SSM20]|uniref:hypothetical protein n=1 Tax=Pseudoalteromonas sp. SSM20 TaxID=3139394 RepID=UPI003BAB9EE6
MKKLIGLVILLTILSTLIVLNSPSKQSTKSISNKPEYLLAPTVPENSAEKNKKISFVEKEYPTHAPSEDMCSNLDYEQYQAKQSFMKEIEISAGKLLEQGNATEDVANAIWLIENWDQAQRWYYRAKIWQSTKKYSDFFKRTNNGESLVYAINDYQIERDAIPSLDSSIETFWNSYSLKELELAFKENASADEILLSITSLFSNVPESLLNDPIVSPLLTLTRSSIKQRRFDVAIKLLTNYPNLTNVENSYENRFSLSILQAIKQSGVIHSSDLQVLKDLILASRLSDQSISYWHETFWLGSNEFVLETINELNQVGIEINYIHTNDLKAEEKSALIQKPILKFTDEQKAQLNQCYAKKEWFKSRQLTIDEWKTYSDSELIKNVKSSQEFKYCEKHKTTFNNLKALTTKPNQQAISYVQQYLVDNKINDVSKLSLTDVANNSLSELDNDLLILMLTNLFVDSNLYTEQQILDKFKEIDFTLSPNNLHIFLIFLDTKALTIWLDEVNLPEQVAQVLLNRLASQGNFALFNTIASKAEVDLSTMTGLDPFYFFISDFSLFSMSIGKNESRRDNNKFFEYFQNNGYRNDIQHQRALLKHKENKTDAYKTLIKEFPELTTSTHQNYFNVRCI